MNNLDITYIEEALKTEDSPLQLSSYLTRLAAINSYRTEQLKQVQLIKPKLWLEIQRPKLQINEISVKPLSDKKTEMIWASTEDGQKEIALTYELKRVDILYRSISKRLSAIENDFRMTKAM